MSSLCFECGAPAEAQHHVIPSFYGGSRTVPLCLVCHGKVHDRKTITSSALIKEAFHIKKENGEYIGRPPLGYKLSDSKVLEEDPTEQKLIARAKELRSTGMPLRKVIDQLKSEDLRTRRGTWLALSTLSRILRAEDRELNPPIGAPYEPKSRNKRRTSRDDLRVTAHLEDILEGLPSDGSRARVVVWLVEKYVSKGLRFEYVKILLRNILKEVQQ